MKKLILFMTILSAFSFSGFALADDSSLGHQDEIKCAAEVGGDRVPGPKGTEGTEEAVKTNSGTPVRSGG